MVGATGPMGWSWSVHSGLLTLWEAAADREAVGSARTVPHPGWASAPLRKAHGVFAALSGG